VHVSFAKSRIELTGRLDYHLKPADPVQIHGVTICKRIENRLQVTSDDHLNNTLTDFHLELSDGRFHLLFTSFHARYLS